MQIYFKCPDDYGNIKMLLLSLTGACNLGCKYCYADSYNENMMTFDIAKKAIALVQSQSNDFIIQFSGGEPLLNINLIRTISQHIKDNNITDKDEINEVYKLNNLPAMYDEHGEFIITSWAKFAVINGNAASSAFSNDD